MKVYRGRKSPYWKGFLHCYGDIYISFPYYENDQSLLSLCPLERSLKSINLCTYTFDECFSKDTFKKKKALAVSLRGNAI